jgi:O-antigen/teichoic acid export membrane protein
MTILARSLEATSKYLPHSAAIARVSGILGIDPSLLLHSFFLLFATVLGQVVSFAVQILVARRIGAEAYGVYSYALTWIGLLALLAVMGNDRLLIRYGSEYRARGELPLLHGVIRWAWVRSLAAACLLGGVFAWATLALAPSAYGRLGVALWGALGLVLVVATFLVESMLRVEEAQVWATLPNRVLQPLFMGGLFLLLSALATTSPNAHGAIAANTLSLLLVVLVGLVALRPPLPPYPNRSIEMPRRAWRGTSLAFGINALALHLNVQTDMLVLGFFHDQEILGIYGAVTRFATVTSFAGLAVVTIVQPMLARAAANATREELQQLVTGGARLVFLATFCFALPILVFAEFLLSIFGHGFEAGAAALRILALGSIVASPVNLAGALLGMTGHEKEATTVMVAGCVLTLALNLLLAPRFGAIGAAAATAASRIAWNFALFRLARARLKINATPFVLSSRLRGEP